MRTITTNTSLFLLTSILSVLAPVIHAKDGSIVFCNEKNFTGECTIGYWFDWGQCFIIPDYKAKADKGSSFKVSPSPFDLFPSSFCRNLYFPSPLFPD